MEKSPLGQTSYGGVQDCNRDLYGGNSSPISGAQYPCSSQNGLDHWHGTSLGDLRRKAIEHKTVLPYR